MHPLYRIVKNSAVRRGPNATVWEARDEVLDREVALKELRNWTSRLPRSQACFQFAHLRRLTLDYPGLAPVHGSDCDRGWLVLDHFASGSLAELSDPLPCDSLRVLLREVLGTLQYLHGKKLLHGAVKPGNLFVTGQGQVLLADGLGLRTGDEKQPPAFLSRIFHSHDSVEAKYLAPECVDGKWDRVGPATDLYALGFTALELLLGETAFAAQFPMVQLKAQRWDEWHGSDAVVPSVIELADGTPTDLGKVIDGLLVKDPDRRLDLAAALALLTQPIPPPQARQTPKKKLVAPPSEKTPLTVEPLVPILPTPVMVAPPPRWQVKSTEPALPRRLLSGFFCGAGGIVLGLSVGWTMLPRPGADPVPAPVAEPVAAAPVDPPPEQPAQLQVLAGLEKSLKEAREALVQEQLESSKQRALGQTLTADLAMARGEVSVLVARVERLSADLMTAQKALSESMGPAEVQRQRANALAGELRLAQAELERVGQAGEMHRQAKIRVEGQLKSVREELAEARADAAKQRAQFTHLAEGWKKAQEERDRAVAGSEKQRKEVLRLSEELKSAKADLGRALTQVSDYRTRIAQMSQSRPAETPGAPPVQARSRQVVLASLRELGAKIEEDTTRTDRPVIRVDLKGSRVTGSNLALLEGLTELRLLDLSSTAVDDASLVHLKGLTRLESLYLYETGITDEGLLHLKGLTRLRSLALSSTRVRGPGLVHLAGLRELQNLNLTNTSLTDEGLGHLKGLSKLQNLQVSTTRITDEGLLALKDLGELETLHLSYTQVTDTGLNHLKELAKLREIHLNLTRVTTPGVANLRKVLPRCQIQN